MKLVRWYRKYHRPLPWRKDRNPYRVWISEIMLQQTRVDTVIPYYERFLKSFPTVQVLAKADVDEVLRHWSGLGYYQRARQLHRAAQMVVKEFGGKIPEKKEEILKLPGVGEYTAGAILSIAFKKREPVVDGNVIRVLTRLNAIGGDPKKDPTKSRLWKEAKQWVAKGDPGIINQALMELGATVCLPASPSCLLCPLCRDCKAYAKGAVDRFPQLPARKKPKQVRKVAFLIEKNGKFLLVRRSARRHLQAMWEFPQIESDKSNAFTPSPFPLPRGEGAGGRVAVQLPPVHHSIMDQKITLTPLLYRCHGPFKKIPGYSKMRWIKLEELSQFPTSSLNHKIAAAYQSR